MKKRRAQSRWGLCRRTWAQDGCHMLRDKKGKGRKQDDSKRKEEDGIGDREDDEWEKEATEAFLFSFNYLLVLVNL